MKLYEFDWVFLLLEHVLVVFAQRAIGKLLFAALVFFQVERKRGYAAPLFFLYSLQPSRR